MYEKLAARGIKTTPEAVLKSSFASVLKEEWINDAMFLDTGLNRVVGVANLPFKAPAVLQLLKNRDVAAYLIKLAGDDSSVMVVKEEKGIKVLASSKSQVQDVEVPANIKENIESILSDVEKWAGVLNENGEHVVDLRTPVPGPHFYTNLLMGNRVGYDHALQTTPKSVVDRLGRGSFRSHAATQVLATRWDMRQEENGFPANRQFYLVEDFKKIFYSADPNDANIESATCTHSQNHTIIQYRTKCGLEIKRTIFILPQMEGMPLATEVQRIEVKNLTGKERNIKLVYTGMFGPATPHAIFEDVTYTNVIMQSSILRKDDGSIMAISPDYYPEPCKEDIRFSSMIIRNEDGIEFPKEFCANYNEFVGNGTLENPENVCKLSNHFYRKGPGFFALAGELRLKPQGSAVVDNFTGLSSNKVNPNYNEDTYKIEIENLINRFSKDGEVEAALSKVKEFFDRYRSFMQIKSSDPVFNTYVNKNLPFQVLYQTFVSRSFCQTQKGYREIGFREIQDIFAAMYYFVGMGEGEFVKQMLKEWCSMIFEFGFAYHNFFWVGKEPGKWSDDALWFVQAAYRYINLTGDIGFLDEEVEIAGTSPKRTRPVYETIKALLKYSGEISIGKHGLPLLDNADWNDCLKLDKDFVDGITKEKLYRKQLEEKGGKFGDPFESDYTESVMNAFLLKVAIDEMISLSAKKGDIEYHDYLKKLSEKLYGNLQEHAWKEDFFARALFNKFKNNEFEYLGAKGDKLSADPEIDGSYFLNSFSWSVLADAASEEQISIMLDSIERTLKTPYGLKLVTLTDLGKLSDDTATGHYFPGDRENGGVFKHAAMMATAAMFKAAKQVKSKELAARLANLGYWMIDLVAPYRTMLDPFSVCGNPRFCTQYNNSETGENIGPMLSGTSTWMILTLMSAYGLEYTTKGIIMDPVMREKEKYSAYTVNIGKAVYNISIKKPEGFCRIADGNAKITVDGNEIEGNLIPLFSDGKEHNVEVVFS
ncbi:MAG TPA: glycosyl transferase [Acetivibrio sp.]|nr:glycosyl transferase [Clostridium sp.]HOQ36918.1 glycosyl transferase [Acetivibrio sp.]HQA56368.1 glycosyl transferase [Acetivibrio sp.]